MLLFLEEDDELKAKFLKYAESEQLAFLKWINAANSIITRLDRIALTVDKISKNKKFSDPS
jgi:uncharacterized protein YdeI (YjbR/CyaY-like superfamily)